MSRIRELALYSMIGLLVAAAAIFIGIYRANRGLSLGVPAGWIGFVIFSILIFWWVIRSHRSFFSNPAFWTALGIFAVVHLAFGYFVLSRLVGKFQLIDFALAAPIEYYVLVAYLRFVLHYKT